MGNFSMRGTPLQKAAYSNTYIFSKIWYVAQSIKLEASVLKKITQKILNFIWAGQNERPVRALNFRSKELGGLGLMCPATKAKSLLLKSMFKDYVSFGSIHENVGKIYGYKNDFRNLLDAGVDFRNVKQIYEQLMNVEIYRNGSLLPSREEKRAKGKWKTYNRACQDMQLKLDAQVAKLRDLSSVYRDGPQDRTWRLYWGTGVWECIEFNSL